MKFNFYLINTCILLVRGLITKSQSICSPKHAGKANCAAFIRESYKDAFRVLKWRLRGIKSRLKMKHITLLIIHICLYKKMPLAACFPNCQRHFFKI
jgi:hypothetical protein